MMAKRAVVGHECVACGTCAKACPFSAISVPDGRFAVVDPDRCVGCGTCAKVCPAEVIAIEKTDEKRDPGKPRPKPVKRERKWYDHLYVVTPIYLTLGFFNILFAWIGLLFFFLPLIFAAAGKGKLYCNRYCDRGQFLDLLGERFGISRRVALPRWIRSKAFRYGFLTFFMVMFINMLAVTWLNPHVYLDTFVVLGSLGGQLAMEPKRWFALGTISASFLWFFGLALLAAWLAPRLRTARAQRIINIVVGAVMWFIAFQLAREGVSHIQALLN